MVTKNHGEAKELKVAKTDLIYMAIAKGFGIPVDRVTNVYLGEEYVEEEDTFETAGIEDGAKINARIRIPLGWRELSNMVHSQDSTWGDVKRAALEERAMQEARAAAMFRAQMEAKCEAERLQAQFSQYSRSGNA